MPAPSVRPLLADKKTETDSKNMVTVTTERTERPRTSEIISSKMTESVVNDRSIKPRPIASKQFIDYKTLKEEEKN